MQFVFREEDRARFEEVCSGVKEIETRAASPKYQSVKVGDEVRFVCGSASFTKKVAKVYRWPSVEAMLKEVPLKRVMPDLKTTEQVRARYASYPDYDSKLKQYGLIGFELE
jgi:ASC-1-like (ASCH) protein